MLGLVGTGTIEAKITEIINSTILSINAQVARNSATAVTIPRVGLQVGHWQNDQVPEELEALSRNTGASASGKTETEVVMTVALLTKEILEDAGVVVDLLPTTVPPDYLADAFISIHADGSKDTGVSGFKIAHPRRDSSGVGYQLSHELISEYAKSTQMKQDHNITRNMTGYYAFNHRRYEHSIHPSTPGALVELGFMTNPNDLEMMLNQPHVLAEGIADGILSFLKNKNSEST